MKFKDLLLGTAAFTFAASTAFFACVLKKGHDFEESMDKTGNALDPVSYTHLDVYKRQAQLYHAEGCPQLYGILKPV